MEEENIIQNEINVNEEYSNTESSEVEIIEVFEPISIPIEVQNAFPALGEDNEDLNHAFLYGRDRPNQHPITAIEGLRQELDKIESLQTVYSDKKQHANYYMWYDKNPSGQNRDGFFVRIYTNDDAMQTIKKCNSETDVFGVTVANAGFVGGQEYIKAEDGKKTSRDSSYGLVVTSGIVNVRCESNIAVGDYVVPNDDGMAKKSNGKYGYLVTFIKDIHGVDYATISLAAPSTFAQYLADNVDNLSGRMTNTERNIASVGNTANTAYKLAQQTKDTTEINIDVVKKAVAEIIDKTEDNETIVNNIQNNLSSLKQSVAQAKEQASVAKKYAETIREDAVKEANNALVEAKKVNDDIKAYKKIVANIDKYTVGEHSQAYGLTHDQAKQVLEIGMVYVPTVGRDENGYINKEEYSPSYQQEFLKGSYYIWNGMAWSPTTDGVTFSVDGEFMPAGSDAVPYLVIENVDVVHEDIVYPKDTLYIWENEKWNALTTISKNVLNRTVALVRHTANEVAQEVTNARGSAATLNARLDEDGAKVSLVASVVTELKDIKPEKTYNTVDDLKATTGVVDKYYCVGTNAPYDVYTWNGTEFQKELLTYDGAHFCKINTASIVGAVNNDGDSNITLNASKINFVSQAFNIFPSKYGVIDESKDANFSVDEYGNTIIRGTVYANAGDIGGCKIKDNQLQVDAAHIISVNADVIDTDSLSAITANLGTVNAGIIQSSNYKDGEIGFKLDLDNALIASANGNFSVNNDGNLITKSGTIGGWTLKELIKDHYILYKPREKSDTVDLPGTGITSTPTSSDPAFYAGYTGDCETPWGDGSWSNNTKFYVTNAGKMVAKEADIKGIINADSGSIGKCTISTDGSITSANGNFKVSAEGNLTAQEGYIGSQENGFKITEKAITHGPDNLSSDTQGIYIGTNGILINGNTGKCRLDVSGRLDSTEIYGYNTQKTHYSSIINGIYGTVDGFHIQSYGGKPFYIGALSTDGRNAYGTRLDLQYGTSHLRGTWETDSSIAVSSDQNLKNSIELIPDTYGIIFDNLQAVRYKYNDGTSGRYHTGFIAQDIKSSILKSGLTTNDFAAYIENKNDNNEITCAIRYEELIALCVNEIQKLKKEIKALKGEE